MNMKLIIEFSGYIYVNENSKFVWFGEGNSQPAIISTKEYLALDAATRS